MADCLDEMPPKLTKKVAEDEVNEDEDKFRTWTSEDLHPRSNILLFRDGQDVLTRILSPYRRV